MLQENEIVTLVIGLGVLAFVLLNRRPLRDLPAFPLALASFCLLAAGWVLTVAEGFCWEEALNLCEHVCYAGSALLLAAWCGRALRPEARRR